MTQIKLAVVDDQALFRKGMIAMLNSIPDFKIELEAENGNDLFEKLKIYQDIEVILLDLRMPEMNGIEATKKLKTQHPTIKIIIISVHDDTDIITHLFEIGANGYLDKNSHPDEVERAIRDVIALDYHFNTASQIALNEIETATKSKNYLIDEVKFSTRERQVLELICQELTTQEVANKLCLSSRTIEGYRISLMNKTGSRNAAGLILFAIRHKLIDTASMKIR